MCTAAHCTAHTHGSVPREDVSAVLVAAIMHPEFSANLRFDLSSDADRPASGDFELLFDAARDWAGDGKRGSRQ